MPKQLQYKQPKATRNKLIIMAGDDVVGSIETRGILRRTTTATFYDQKWLYIKKGLINTQIIVNSDSGIKAILTQRVFRRKSSITIGSATYTFKPQGIHLKSQYVWQNQIGATIVTYKLGGIIKQTGSIDIDDSLQIPSDLQLLIPLGLFIGTQQDADSAAAGASASG